MAAMALSANAAGEFVRCHESAKVVHEQGKVLKPFAQGRDGNFQRLDAKVKVLAKLLNLDQSATVTAQAQVADSRAMEAQESGPEGIAAGVGLGRPLDGVVRRRKK